jgi:hypothetical protein
MAGVLNLRYPTWSLDIHSALTIGAASYSFRFSLRCQVRWGMTDLLNQAPVVEGLLCKA